MSPHAKNRWPSWTLALVATLALPTLFSTGCLYVCDDDDFDDDDCHYDDDDFYDDDDHHGVGLEKDPDSPYRLRDYELIESTEARRHPVAWLRNIRGINLFSHDPSVDGATDHEAFTGLLIQENEALLALPATAGRLTYAPVVFEPAGFRVTWRQETPGSDENWKPVPGAELVFYFDAVGNLLTVQNTTWLQPPE